jgi:hypothetical protein
MMHRSVDALRRRVGRSKWRQQHLDSTRVLSGTVVRSAILPQMLSVLSVAIPPGATAAQSQLLANIH